MDLRPGLLDFYLHFVIFIVPSPYFTFVNRCRHLSPSEINARLRDEIPHVTRLRLDDTVINYDDAICGPSTDNVSLREGDPVLVKTGEGLVASCGSDFCHVLVKTKSQVDWQ